jgi:hypothetical protein
MHCAAGHKMDVGVMSGQGKAPCRENSLQSGAKTLPLPVRIGNGVLALILHKGKVESHCPQPPLCPAVFTRCCAGGVFRKSSFTFGIPGEEHS